MSVQDELQLDASSSFDEDVNPDCGDGAGDWQANFGRRRLAHNDKHGAVVAGDCGTGDDAGLSFSWICEELEVLADGKTKLVSGSCATDSDPFPTGAWASNSVKQLLTLSGTWLGTGHYRFSVTAASADARTSTTSVDIELANEEPQTPAPSTQTPAPSTGALESDSASRAGGTFFLALLVAMELAL